MFGDLQFPKVLEFNYAVFYIYFVLLCVLSDKEGSEEKGNIWLEVMANVPSPQSANRLLSS